MKKEFVKMHGIGNDFIIMDFYSEKEPDGINYNNLAKRLCQRHFGIGADGLILILPSKKYDLRMRIFNFDGSEPQMCGNGIRCFAKYAYENKLIEKKIFSVETLAGEIIPEIIFNEKTGFIEGVKVDMGEPRLTGKEIPVTGNPDKKVINQELLVENNKFMITCVSMGNPHCVIFIEDVEGFPVREIGPLIEINPFFPEKTNVEFIEILNDHEINFRVWERGVGETMACGTGACAAVVAGVLNKKVNSKAIVHLNGGDLKINWADDGHVYMTGPAESVFEGSVSID
ncbi:MAG: diaminopimelate epimerase [Atribacterota bacterium]|nr:diaminopimelate epimerase [Atribacterota bacterium]MDD4764547.1 diaminopimelate epimerase [Atribacterota bacterium]